MSTLSRDYVADIEIRSDGTGRTVHGIVVPYGQVARVSDGGAPYSEMFAPGAFARDLLARAGNYAGVKLLYQHDSHNPIGRAIDLREDASGLYGAFRISNVDEGNRALELLRDGVLDSFSVGFRPMEHDKREGVTVRTRAALRETSLVTFPAYVGAMISGVRSLSGDDAVLAQQLLTVLAVADARLDPIADAIYAADGALDAAQTVIAQILGTPNPEDMGDCCDCCGVGCDCGDCPTCSTPAPNGDAGMVEDYPTMTMSSHLTSLARGLDAALARVRAEATADGRPEKRNQTDPDSAAATPLGTHPSHRSLRALAREKGIL